MNKQPDRRMNGVLERHIGTVLTALVLASVISAGSTMKALLEDIAVLKVEFSHMKDLLELSSSRAYTKVEARGQINIFNGRFRSAEKRIEALEKND